jgi:hypothetical protein
MAVTCGALHARDRVETIAVTFPAKLTGFDVDNVTIKILLVFGFVGNMAFALFARVG